MAEEKRTEVSFNIGVAQATYVGSVYTKVFNALNSGDFNAWYSGLATFQEILWPDLKEDSGESDELEENKEAVRNLRVSLRKARSKKEYMEIKADLFDALIEYHRCIMKYVKKLGYLPSKKDRTNMRF